MENPGLFSRLSISRILWWLGLGIVLVLVILVIVWAVGGAGDDTTTWVIPEEPDNSGVTPPVPESPTSLDAFIFYPGQTDTTGNVLQKTAGIGHSSLLADYVLQNPGLVGFDTDGWVKKSVGPTRYWSTLGSTGDQGMYVLRSHPLQT